MCWAALSLHPCSPPAPARLLPWAPELTGEAAPQSLAKSARAFDKTDDLTVKARLILQNPDFLNMALRLDPSATRELAALCDQVSQALHMELDEKLRSAPGAVENPLPLNEQKAASARRMRM